MKNVSHRVKHRFKKALRDAAKLPITEETHHFGFQDLANGSIFYFTDLLRPLDKKIALETLAFYKKHLERAQYFKSLNHSKRTTPGEVISQKAHRRHSVQPTHLLQNLDSAKRAETSNLSHKMLKYGHQKKKNF
jgi:hypothetical protein